jgi:hypothetical protein
MEDGLAAMTGRRVDLVGKVSVNVARLVNAEAGTRDFETSVDQHQMIRPLRRKKWLRQPTVRQTDGCRVTVPSL